MKNKTTYNRAMHDKKHPYTPISAVLINNTDLTGEERFLLIYLFGRSNDYILNSSYFAKDSQKLFGWGRDKFYKVWTNLQTKGYIIKQMIRTLGVINGHHYTVHETITPFRKNQNPENPESGKSRILKTSALPSIDKPTIDKPTIDKPTSACGLTKTNLNGASFNNFVDSDLMETNKLITEIFDLICELNPSEYSDNWKLNDQDRELIEKAISNLGFVDTQILVYQTVDTSGKLDYYSVSYIFSEFKDSKPISDTEDFIPQSPNDIPDLLGMLLSDEKVEKAISDCKDEQEFYNFLKNIISPFHVKAKQWVASNEDLDHCALLLEHDTNLPIAKKLRAGLKSACDKKEWRFGQVVYQAIAAIETKEMLYT